MSAPKVVGSPGAFLIALTLVTAWVTGGFAVGWSDTRAIQLKLDEILRAHEHARTGLVKLEAHEHAQLARVKEEMVQARSGEAAAAARPREPGT